MNLIEYPQPETWSQWLERPGQNLESLIPVVQKILTTVKTRGDEALLDYTAEFDHVVLDGLRVPVPDRVAIDPELADAIETAHANLVTFHKAQEATIEKVVTQAGITCWRKSLPIQKVGLYVPGGSAPLFSSLLMLGVPAKLAGCEQIVVCTPPNKEGRIHQAILFTARLLGLNQVYAVGGAQAIAAMAYGTSTVPRVYKIFGPGNAFVTVAKQLAQTQGVAIDMPAGPSEVLIIADDTARPDFVAADLLSQAEHGPDSQVILISDSKSLIEATLTSLNRQLNELPRKTVAAQSIANSRAFLVNSMEEAFQLSNAYAPEHLILSMDDANTQAEQVINAGSVFLGHYSCESMGDYASGTNHTLPTHGYARNYSGVSLDSFVKKITFQEVTEAGIKDLGPKVEKMAAAEGLDAHERAVTVRLKDF